MEISLFCIGKSQDKWSEIPIADYLKRISHYINFSIVILPDIKNISKLSPEKIKFEETKLLLDKILSTDFVILLDERGKQYTSIEFAGYIQKLCLRSLKKIVFIIGGPYGFSEEIYCRADALLSLSKMTFTHNMIRLFFIEQIYRAMTIIRGESYHH